TSKLVCTASLQGQLESTRVAVQGISERKLNKREKISIEPRLSEAEEEICVLAIKYLNTQAHAIAYQCFDTATHIRCSLGAQTPRTKPAKDLFKIRELVVASHQRVYSPAIVDGPG